VQVREIIEAAERTAAAIVEDARAEARRQLDEARAEANRAAARRVEESARLTDELIGRTEAVRRQSDELLRLLGETKQHFDEASEGTPRPGQPPSYLREVAGQSHRSDAPGGRHAEGARLLAAQMAVAGSSRAEIAATLRDRFAIEDPGPMLDAILGQEG
jgi:vacuolar-type H+-ATPase subunit H